MKPLGGFFVELEKAAALVALRLLCGIIVLDQDNAGTLCKLADSTGEIDMLVIHHKPEDTASSTTTEAMECLPRGIHMERGALLLMKGAEGSKASPCTLQWKITSDNLRNIAGVGDLLNTLFGDPGHG